MSIFKIYSNQYLLTILLLLCTPVAWSQKLFATIFAGESNYSGDLQEKRFTFTQAHPAFGVGLLYEATDKLAIRGDFTYGKISAQDKFSKNFKRNLSFYSNISEYSLGFEYTFFNLYNYKTSPFIYGGVALFDFNPYTKDNNGNPVFLPELSTEGQGFVEGRKDYKLRQYSIPMGGGIQWAINDNKRLGFVVGFRKTFTDYIDDVSTTYVDENTLRQKKGQKVVDIAYRGDELPNGAPYPTGGTKRGSEAGKDWYYFMGLTFRVRVAPKKRIREFKYNPKRSKTSSLRCPTLY